MPVSNFVMGSVQCHLGPSVTSAPSARPLGSTSAADHLGRRPADHRHCRAGGKLGPRVRDRAFPNRENGTVGSPSPLTIPAPGKPVDLLCGWYASQVICYAVGMQNRVGVGARLHNKSGRLSRAARPRYGFPKAGLWKMELSHGWLVRLSPGGRFGWVLCVCRAQRNPLSHSGARTSGNRSVARHRPGATQTVRADNPPGDSHARII
jgi:hypothetical protein